MIIIDGSEGEGGGQVVRNACALSMVTGESFRISNIRGRRSKPGLMRQHVTAIEAACAISNSDCTGIFVGSSEIVFKPGKVKPGNYHFAVGTAGSTGLVLQTVLMPLVMADGASRLVLEGGTHNPSAPPFDFIERSFLPIINAMGTKIEVRLHRHGFYPRGGGHVEVDIAPGPLKYMNSLDRGEPLGVSGQAVFASLPFDIAQRMITRVRKAFPDWPEEVLSIRELPADEGPGVILLLEARYASVTEIVSGFGQLGLSGDLIAKTSAARLRGYIESSAFAGPYLADQLVLPFVLAGSGTFTTVKPSQHLLTAIDLAKRFTGRRIDITREANGNHVVSVK